MDSNTTFSAIDIMALENLNLLILRMESYLDKIRPAFSKQFGGCKIPSNLDQIKKHGRYIIVKEGPFGNGWNEIGAGFDFKENVNLAVWVWCSSKNSRSNHFKSAMKDQLEFDTNSNDWIGLYKPLSDFISSENMEIEIEKWFVDAFGKVKEFANSTPELEWRLQ